ncbi:MAG: hypothetical protein QOD30_1170, partial [Actinomycetota bacterium]|nr:hypothetical protein [Actinomycetota bacterium]
MTITDLGTLVDERTIRFERRLAAPVERVWHAVTDPDEMRSWFPSAVQGERKIGAPLRFPFDDNVADAFTGEVTEWEPSRVFGFTWNHDQLRIELTPDGDGTLLVFTHQVYDASIAARTGAGWHTCLANLGAHLGGPPAVDDLWRATYPDYLERMGPPPARMSRSWVLEYERAHHVTPERLWQCLTDPAELRVWTGFEVTIDPTLGGRTCWFDGSEHPEEGVVVAIEPQRRLAYTFGDVSVVEWEIEPTDFGCRYRMRHHGLDRENAVGKGSGWHGFLLQLDMYAASNQLVEDTGYEA